MRNLAILAPKLGLVLTVLMSNATAAPVRIGREARVDLPASALNNRAINFRPGDGETVTLNPPQFQWCYTTNALVLHTDLEEKRFVFQVASDAKFQELKVNVTTPWNFYNTLAPFTNSLLYWRVGYIHEKQTNVYFWSAIRQFNIATNAAIWDRSMLASETYLADKARHPRIMVNATNRLSLHKWLEAMEYRYKANTINRIEYDAGRSWEHVKKRATAAINSPWWPNSIPTNVWRGDWANSIAQVCMMWAITTNATWSGATPQRALIHLADYFRTNKLFKKDAIIDAEIVSELQALATGYDWIYDLMNAEERAKVLGVLAMRCRYDLRGAGNVWADSKDSPFSYGKGDPTGKYANGFHIRSGSSAKFGMSHGSDTFHWAMLPALAGYGEHPWCREMFDMGINFMLGPTYVYGCQMMDGRPYGVVHLGESKMLFTHMLYQTAFSEAGWTNNPFLSRAADWYDRVIPTGFSQGHEPWGDEGYGRMNSWQYNSMGRNLALFTGNGRYLRHWEREAGWYAPHHYRHPDEYPAILFPYYFKYNLRPQDTTNLAALYPEEGWLASASRSPSSFAGFENGVGMVFQARPSGNNMQHSHLSDGSFQMWAYGASITDAGGLQASGNQLGYAKLPCAHYTLMVNGLGQCQPNHHIVQSAYARFLAYTNNDTFTYAAADLTQAYPTTKFDADGWLLPSQFRTLHSGGPLSYVTNVTRQILFQRKKYLVLYDTLQTSNRPTNTFSWLYHILEPTLKLNRSTMSFSYTATNHYNGSNVTVYVAHIGDPARLTVTNLSGSNVRMNPFTGENYWINVGQNTVGDKYNKANVLWFSNARPTNQFHFMTVVYPVKWGQTAPTITRLDDHTVTVENGDESDTISFDPQTKAPATVVVNLPEMLGSRSP